MAQQDNYIGIAMGLDVTDLQSGLTEVKKSIKNAELQFKSATAGMDRWKQSSEGLNAKLDLLDTTLIEQKRVVNGYQAELDKTVEKYGENSVQAENLRQKLAQAQIAVEKTAQSQRYYTEELAKVSAEERKASTDVDKLSKNLASLGSTLEVQKQRVAQYEAELEDARKEHGDTSDEVQTLTKKLQQAQDAVADTERKHQQLADQLQKVQSETKDTKTDTEKMTRALKDADDATVDLKGGFTVLKGAMADLASTAIQSVISGIQNIVTESREFRTEMSYLQATADDTGVSFDQAQEKVKEVYAVLGETDSAVEGMNNLMTAGFNGESLNKITDQLVGASIKWHDTLKFEGLSDGLQETLATGKAIGPFAELLERGGMNLEKFDEGLEKCKTDAEKQNYVLQQLNKLGLTEITEGYRESNKELVEGAEAQFDYEQAMSEVGAKAEPVMTTIKQGWVDVLGAFLDNTEGMDTADLQGKIKEAFQWFIDDAIPKIKEGLTWIIDNINILAPLVGGMAGLWATWKVGSIIADVVGGIKKMVQWTKTLELAKKKELIVTKAHTIAEKARAVATGIVTGAQKLLNIVMNANPIGLVITAIVALIAIFAVLWNKCDWFREFWIDLWDKIVEWCGKAWESIKEFFSKAWKWIQQAWAGTVEWFGNLWNGIKNVWSDVTTWFGNLFESAKQTVQNIWSGIVGFFQSIWNGIKAVFSFVVEYYRTLFTFAVNTVKSIWSGIVTFFQNIWLGIKTAFSNVGTWFSQIFTTAKNAIQNAWSTITGFFSNIWSGIKNIFASVGAWFLERFNTAKNAIQNAWSTVTGFFSKIWSGIKKVFSSVSKWFGEKFRTAKNAVQSAWNNVVSFFRRIWNGIKSAFSTVASTLGGFFRRAWNNIKSAWSGVSSWFSNIVNKIVGFFKDIPDKLKQIGKDMMDGLIDGVKSMTKKVKKAVENAVDSAVKGVKDFLGIESPSKLMRDQVGAMMGEGVGVGILGSTNDVLRDAQTFAKKVSDGLNVQMSDIQLGLDSTMGGLQGVQGSSVKTVNYTQVINAPRAPRRIELYRDTKNLLSWKEGY